MASAPARDNQPARPWPIVPAWATVAPAEPRWAEGYAIDSVTVAVSGNDPADKHWLDEFLHPWCRTGSRDQATVTVRMIRSDAMAQALAREWTRRRRQSPPLPRLACVRLDTRTIAFESWPVDGGLCLADPPLTGCFFIVRGAAVDVIAPGGQHRAQLGLLALMREILAAAMLRHRPVIDLHAAAFALADGAVLLAGPKRAGKTSLLCHAILSGGAALMANDRTFVDMAAEPPVACGVPTVAAIRQGTVAAFPQLAERAAEFPTLPRIEPAGAPPQPSPAEAGLLLSPARLAGRLGAGQVNRAPLKAIVLPEICDGSSGWTVTRLPQDIAAARLEAHLYGIAQHRDAPTFFGALAGQGLGELPSAEDNLRRLAALVPTFQCRMGHDVYQRPAAALLRALGMEEVLTS